MLSPQEGYAAKVLMWHEVVASFRRRQLTVLDDRLPAVSAVAAKFAELRTPRRYLAGLWADSLPEDLLWEVVPRHSSIDLSADITVPRPIVNKHDESRADQDGPFPSWSWASVSGLAE